ncbi:hypothetical protein CEXT_204031 [Caerostris extrusa]|uniref:DNA topoisomerase I DNA binding eukaryotic-type domain-containing protein n=1 Tax=Caerostris extrusa TaxID=172846 RepID=A0AAV4UB94_CAEEX|nr:hypothetical protein CEXT_204031 [Caerostris extrusa]
MHSVFFQKHHRNQMRLSKKTEEVAGLYAQMMGHRCASTQRFKNNFFNDWTEVMTSREREIIEDFRYCDFADFKDYYKQKARERKTMTREEKLVSHHFQNISLNYAKYFGT